MSPQKLLELALLDASGVLDADETAEFERSFAAADDDLKAQVRLEQARFADVSEILPDVSPRPELRNMVIDSVLAASGRQRDAVGSAILSHAASERLAKTKHRRSSIIGWRVATFAFATAFAAVGTMAFQLNQQFGEVTNSIQTNARIDTLLDLGQEPDFLSAMLDESFDRSPMLMGDEQGQASIFVSAEEGVGYLALRGLQATAPGTSYVLVALGDNDEQLGTLTEFTTAGETTIIEFEYAADLGTSFAIALRDSAGNFELLYRTTA
ncbi:MAG: hypothetical protein AAFR76_09100 [Planctomycetota bacterium]